MKKFNYLLLIILLVLISCEKNTTKNDKPLVISGKLVNNSNCKTNLNLKASYLDANTPDSLSCVEYSFDNKNNQLTIKHINAGFNCCPDSLYCDVKLKGDTILIQEFEKMFVCDCNCLYDLDIKIDGVEGKKYILKFEEPYALDQSKLIFEIDLSKKTVGEFCVTRKGYPWGIHSLN